MTILEPCCPDLIARFTLVKNTPVEFDMNKFSAMPFKMIDKIWEKYGVARVFDINDETQTPLVECWYPPNTVRAASPAVLKSVVDRISAMLPPELRSQKEDADFLLTFLGSRYMQTIAVTVGRLRDYQIYMNSVSSIQIPVDDI